jgi:hypothetical protein
MSDIDSSLVDVERTGSTSALRSEDAGPLLGLAAAAEEEQRETALSACHVVTVTPPVLRQPNPELRASALREQLLASELRASALREQLLASELRASALREQLLASTASKLRGVIRVQYGNLV